jgi:hypothetical protein
MAARKSQKSSDEKSSGDSKAKSKPKKAAETKARIARGAYAGVIPAGTKLDDIDPPLTADEKERLKRLGVI